MDEKIQLAGHQLDPIPRPTSTSTVDDSEFESHDDASTLYTPRTSVIENTHSDLPPTYEQSQAALHDSAGVQPPPAFPYPPGVQNHSNITVYRTELPPDPVVPIRGQGEEGGQPKYPDEKQRPISPTGPKASGLLSEALRFTETPPPVSETRQRLRFPVALPSLTRDPSISKFARFFAAVLDTQSVTASEFLDFIDGLNALATASSFTTSTFQTRNALTSFEVPRDDADIPREDLISAYIALSNTHFFNARGLQVQITDLTQLADLVNMSNPVIRKAILEEVLRNSKAGIDVPAAANGAAHAAAQAMVPYIEPLTTAVPEPKKHNESMESVASRLAALGINNDESVPRESTQDTTRADYSRTQSDPSQFHRPNEGPSRPPTWQEWGDQFGRKWGRWGEHQGRKWGDWGREKGEFWGKWGEEKGRKFEQLGDVIAQKAASPPWAWRGGGRDPSGRGSFGGGPFGGPCVGGRNGPFGNNGGPFGGNGGPFGARGSPFGAGGGPFGRRAMTQPYPQPHIPNYTYADVPIPPLPGQSVGHIPVMPGAYPQHPSLHNIHQPPTPPGPPPPPGGPFGLRGELPDNKEQEDHEEFDDAASISSSSTDSSSSSDKTYIDTEKVFADKVAAIEAMAATARTNHSKPPSQIEKERVRALHIAEKEKTKREWAQEKRARKKDMKGDKKAWKNGKKNEYRAWKREQKNAKREWKKGVKGEYRGWKEEMRKAKREGKRRDVGDRRHGGRRGRHDHDHDHERGFPGGPSMESLGRSTTGTTSLNEDVEVRAKEMLWVVLTNYE